VKKTKKGAEEDALKTILAENAGRRKYTFTPAEIQHFRVGGHSYFSTSQSITQHRLGEAFAVGCVP